MRKKLGQKTIRECDPAGTQRSKNKDNIKMGLK
jgi:hypothetical protein